MTEQDRPGTYNPFEDTGDWPFRESGAPAPPREAEEAEQPPASPVLFDREAHEPEPKSVPATEPEPEPEPRAEPEPEPEAEAAPVEIEDDLPAPEAFPEEPSEPHEPFVA